jgi:Spy/CpxP family protein refolding chaperone
MKHRALLGALGLSLLFNIFVLVGFVQSRAGHRDGLYMERHRPHDQASEQRGNNPPINRWRRDLNLDEKQLRTMASLHEHHRQRSAVFDQSIALVRQSMREEIRKEQPDIERVRELVNEEAELFRQRRMTEANAFGKFMDELTPEQRKAMMERMRRSGSNQPPQIPPKILERFDADGSGHLDATEMREARREMDRRRREMAESQDGPPPPPSE